MQISLATSHSNKFRKKQDGDSCQSCKNCNCKENKILIDKESYFQELLEAEIERSK